jgi:hypothetical protein
MSRYYRTYLEESGSAYTTRTTAFASATGITDTIILGALNTFDLGLISNSLDTKMKALYPMVGGTSTTCKYNFMNPLDTNAAYRLQFNGGLTFSSTGVQGNGTNGYANTYFTGTNWAGLGDASMGMYTRTNETGSDSVDLGAFSVPFSNNFLRGLSSSGSMGAGLNSSSGAGYILSTNTTTKGFYIANRKSTIVFEGWKNGVKQATNTDTATNLLNVDIYLFAYNNNGVSAIPSTREYQFGFIGDALSDTQATNLSSLVHNMQTTLGRNY